MHGQDWECACRRLDISKRIVGMLKCFSKISYASWKSLITNIVLSFIEGKVGRDGRDGKMGTKVGVKIWLKKWMTKTTTQNGKKRKKRWRECSIKSQTAFKLKEYCLQNSEFELNHMYILGKFTDELNFICRDWNRLLTSYIDVIWATKWSNKTAEYYKYISLKFWRSSLLVLNDFLQIKSDSKEKCLNFNFLKASPSTCIAF